MAECIPKMAQVPMSKKSPKKEFDSPWKNILDIYFEQFILLCWPEHYSKVDWSRGYKSLDKEMHKIARAASIGNRIADKLIEIHLKNGQEAYVLIHIEVQGNREKYFEERMFTSRCRFREMYKKPIASIAILIDKNKNWRPHSYREELWGSSVEMRFPIIKILDYKEHISELEVSSNPFAAVILAQLAVLEKGDQDAKLISKIKLVRWLFRRGWKKDVVQSLLTFIDWVLALSPGLELECKKELKMIEEELRMNYVTSWERMGIEEGIHQGERAVLLRQLEYKFKEVPETYRKKIEHANDETLMKWAMKLLDSYELDDVFRA